MEIYKNIKGYEGLYQVSNLGNVKSLRRIVKNRKGFQTLRERILKPQKHTGGYLQVGLSKERKVVLYLIHQLVGQAFLNYTIKGFDLVINHKDFDRKNNKLNNLERVTQRKNANKKHLKSASIYTGVYKSKKGWYSQIRTKEKQYYLGCFSSELEASKAYERALINIC